MSAETVEKSVQTSEFNRWLIGLLLVVTLVCLGVSGWCWREVRQMQAELAQRPPIAVLPIDAVLQSVVNSNDPGAVEHAAMRIKDAGHRLRDQGYIVLDGSRLVAYPKEFEVRPDVGGDQ